MTLALVGMFLPVGASPAWPVESDPGTATIQFSEVTARAVTLPDIEQGG